jgi:hypothetical protein
VLLLVEGGKDVAEPFTIGVVTVAICDDPVTIKDAPSRGKPAADATAAQPATFETVDGWLGRFGFFEYPEDGTIVGKFYWHRDPLSPPYDRLKNAGSVSVVTAGDRWVVPLRAMMINGKDWATLNRVNDLQLDAVAGGSFRDLVGSLGDTDVGLYEDMVPQAGKNVAAGLGMSVPAGHIAPLMGMIAVTRPLALVKKLSASL